ncbi:MAG: carbon-nitrogen hydrolase family protein [Gammaproteobacteria bacterium]|nr:carbon-nitrogen hydrolase family protein [Gammaproteobacteria bacterium]MDX2459211.1 carbon-nitrogen hydrolase family protein [Gammaproteobacteria bacterium]
MAEQFKVALVQNRAGADMDANIAECSEFVRQAHDQGADLICLPEMFSCRYSSDGSLDAGPHPQDSHPALQHFSNLAAELGTWIQPGSVAVETPSNKLRNRAVMFDPTGAQVAQYDKVHMFDVDLADGESYRESEIFESGDEAVLAPTPWGLVGMTVCYDLRFAYLYRTLAQAGARYLTVPAAFMRTTGKAHWHVLLRSRAIETGCYVFAACQWGAHGDAVTYGHSLVVAPWGEVIADGGESGGVVIADVDPAKVEEARAMVPALRHDRPLSSPKRVSVGRASG